MIPAGSDKLRDIGRPRATWPTHPTAADVTTALQEWQALVKDMFPPKAKEAKTRFEIAAHYKEEGQWDVEFLVSKSCCWCMLQVVPRECLMLVIKSASEPSSGPVQCYL